VEREAGREAHLQDSSIIGRNETLAVICRMMAWTSPCTSFTGFSDSLRTTRVDECECALCEGNTRLRRALYNPCMASLYVGRVCTTNGTEGWARSGEPMRCSSKRWMEGRAGKGKKHDEVSGGLVVGARTMVTKREGLSVSTCVCLSAVTYVESSAALSHSISNCHRSTVSPVDALAITIMTFCTVFL
jgi:hypothetical protein